MGARCDIRYAAGTMRAWVAWGMLVAYVFAWHNASADEVSARARRLASEHMDRGLALYKKDNYRAALAEFKRAHALTRAWQVLIHIGIAQSRMFRYHQAAISFERFLREGGRDIAAGQRATAERELETIRALVGRVRVVVRGPPAGITLDGIEVGVSPLADDILVGPGPHVFRATRPGDVPREQRINVTSGQRLEVDLTPQPKPKPVGTLSISSQPPGARLTLNGAAIGSAPWRGVVPAGQHDVAASRPGFESSTRDVLVVAGQTRMVSIALAPLPGPPPTPWYRKWPYWVGIGAVAATIAGATLIVVDARRRDFVTIRYP